jgi:hypothetical protein
MLSPILLLIQRLSGGAIASTEPAIRARWNPYPFYSATFRRMSLAECAPVSIK